MTEAEWLACTDPLAMLQYVYLRNGGMVNQRKLRLFGLACCRRIWPRLADPRSRRAIEVAERYVDGFATEEELDDASAGAYAAWDAEWDLDEWEQATLAAGEQGQSLPLSAAAYNSTVPPEWWGGAPAFVAPNEIIRDAATDRKVEGSGQCSLLRDIFNLFRMVTPDPIWLTPQVVALARTIYDNRAFDLMPTLSNELAEAGCTNAEFMIHCRAAGEHVRGCWVIDALLGRE
jgi:hypothetical protein